MFFGKIISATIRKFPFFVSKLSLDLIITVSVKTNFCCFVGYFFYQKLVEMLLQCKNLTYLDDNEFIKNCRTKLVHWLNEFLNICYRHIQIPKQWRHTNVICLLKPGKPETSPRSYCPISLLCTTYKLLEQILLTRIEPIIDKLLPKEQAGFQKGHSTVDQVAILTETIEDAFDKKEIMGSVFIDLTAAYDTVWHQGLHVKLQQMLAFNHLINFILELLYTRSFTLFTSDGQKSQSFRLKNGVAQGSILAPTLYNINTADFLKTSGNCFMYADDVAITYSASSIAKV